MIDRFHAFQQKVKNVVRVLTKEQRRTYLVSLLFMVLNSLTMSQMPVITKELQDKFTFSGAEIGLLTSIFMVAFAVGAIPMGLAAARWGGPGCCGWA